MVDTDITRADMVIMMNTAVDKAHMAMKTMEKKIKMTLLAMITKKMAKTIMDTAMETVDTVRKTMDMVKETVDTVIMVDMAMETMIMVTAMVDTAPLIVDIAMAKMDTEEVTDIQTIQAKLTVIKVIPRVTHQDLRTVQKATADTNDY